LAWGGTYKELSPYPQTFLTHSSPTIHENCIIVTPTHPTVQTGHQAKDGWFLSDFYAFNYLLKRLRYRSNLAYSGRASEISGEIWRLPPRTSLPPSPQPYQSSVDDDDDQIAFTISHLTGSGGGGAKLMPTPSSTK